MIRLRAVWLLLVYASALSFSELAPAQPLSISHTFSPSGSSLLRLTGLISACTILDTPTIVVTTSSIAILTPTRPTASCFASPPPRLLDETIDVGFLRAGRYNITWSFSFLGQPAVVVAATQIDVAADSTPSAIPALSSSALLLTL